MCGAFSIVHPFRDISGRFNAGYNGPKLPLHYNARPTQQLPVIVNYVPDRIVLAKWGMTPAWKSGKPIINARAETLTTKPMFYKSFLERRCLVLADGFFEWGKVGAKKVPFRFTLRTKELFVFAGLWREEKDEAGQLQTTFVIITTEPNSLVGKVHDRMPVILPPKQEKAWLDPDQPQTALERMLAPFPAHLMKAYPVSPLVNSPANNTIDVIKPARL